MANNIGNLFKEEFYTDDNVSMPVMKDFFYNSLEPLLESRGVTGKSFKYIEDPIGGEENIGFLDKNKNIFSIHCTKDAFDLSEKALYTGMTDGDSFVFNPNDKSVSVGALSMKCSQEGIDEAQKYLSSLKPKTSVLKENTQYDKTQFERYKEYLQLQLMCVNAPETGHFIVGRILDSLVESKEFQRLQALSNNYAHVYYRPEFEDENGKAKKPGAFSSKRDLANYIQAYKQEDKLYFYKKRQVWRIEDDAQNPGYGLYYIYNYGANLDADKQALAFEIRNDVFNKIQSSKKIIIQIPSSISVSKNHDYLEAIDTKAKEKYPYLPIFDSFLYDTANIINGIISPSWLLYTGYNVAGLDKYGRVVSVIYLKLSIDGSERWINLNKYILCQYISKVQNLTENTTPVDGIDFYISNAPKEFRPESYNINIENYQDSLIKEGLENMQQEKRRVDIQKKTFAKAGYSLCSTEEDLYKWTVSIGDVSFFIPPTQIKATNTTSTERMPVLRAKGTMAKQTEKTESMVELTLYFNNEEGINGYPMEMDLWEKRYMDKDEKYKTSSEAFKSDPDKIKEKDNGLRTYYMNGLRALLSEFKFCPFLPIVNKYINEVLNVHAVSLEQIMVKTVPNFPRLLSATVVMRKFDYQVYMPELPSPYFDMDENGNRKSDILVNPFARCINYDVLRYYYQKPLIRGNEILEKLEAGKSVRKEVYYDNGKRIEKEAEESYTFNSIPFIRDTLFANRTALMPCRFKDPAINIYVADEDYLISLQSLKRTIWQNKLQGAMDGTGYASEIKRSSENSKRVAKFGCKLYNYVYDFYGKYEKTVEEIKLLAFQKANEPIRLEDRRLAPIDVIEYKGKKYTVNDALIELVAKPLKKDLELCFKDKKNESGQNLAADVFYTINDSEPFKDIDKYLGKEDNLYNLKIVVVLNTDEITNTADIKEMAEQAFAGLAGVSSSLSLTKTVPLTYGKDKAIVFTMTDFETGYNADDSQSWVNVVDRDKLFLEYCNDNKEILESSDTLYAEMKDAMDHETVKSIKFTEFLTNALVSDFEAGINNNFARVSILDSEESAAQYMGSSDIYMSWHIRTKDADTVAMLKNLPSYEAHCMRNYHEVLPCFPIRIDSEFTRLMGVFEVSVESVEATTIPNLPGVYDVVIRTISTDRTLRNRETLHAINDEDEFKKNPDASIIGYKVNKDGQRIDDYGDVINEKIDNSGIKKGAIRSQIRIRTQQQLELKLAKTEVYPDLELPTIKELSELGFRFIRYKDKEREATSLFVDPDFYIYYSHVILSEIIRKQIESMFSFVEEDDPLKKAKKKAQNTLEYSMSDLNGARVPVNAFMEADISKANDTMKEINDKLINRLKREQKAYSEVETRRELAARFPALFLADKGIWNIGTKLICAFKESYIVNLERELQKAEKNASLYGKKAEELEELKNTFIKDKFCQYKRNNITSPITKDSKGYLADSLNDSFYIASYNLGGFSAKEYEKEIAALGISMTDELSNIINEMLKAVSATQIGKFEFNRSIEREKWEGRPYQFYGIDSNDREIASTDENKEDGNHVYRFSGPMKIRRYSKTEILPLLSEEEKTAVINAPREKTVFVLDPYYRLLSDEEVEAYLKKCRSDHNFCREAEFRIIFWWLEKLYLDAGLFPSLSYDIDRKKVIASNLASNEALKIIEKHIDKSDPSISVNSVLVDNKTLESMSDYVKTNSVALDAGKFFIAALFAIVGKPLDGNNLLYNKLVERDYDYLNSYILNLTSFNTDIAQKYNRTDDAVLRKFLLALAGYGIIKGPEYIGRSTGATPAQQFSSNYNTKFALAACLDPNKYIYHSFYNMIRGDYRGRLLRAFPTFYCMFIDEGKEIGLWKINDNFYSINGINEINIIKSRKLAADTCSIILSNNYGTFTMDDEDSYINYMGDFFGELYESIFDQRSQAERAQRKRRQAALYVNRAKLTPGIRIHVRMGYGSDARELAGVFNGVIAEVQPNGSAVKIVAQGNGIELMNQILYDNEADEIAFFDEATLKSRVGSGATPREILKSLLITKGGALNLYLQGKYSKDQWFYKMGEAHWDTDFAFGLAEFLNARNSGNLLGIAHFGDPGYKDVFPEGEIMQNIYEVSRYPSLAVPGLELYNDILADQGYIKSPNAKKLTSSEEDIVTNTLALSQSEIEEETGGLMSDLDVDQNKEVFQKYAASSLNSKGPKISFNTKGKTFWDAMNICQSVGLNYICYYATFGFRDTIFLGKPYYYYAYDYARYNGSYIEKRKPFQQYHIYYSMADIIQNNITASSQNMKTVALGYYQEDNGITTSTESVGPIYVDKDIFVENQKSFVFDTRLLFKPKDKWFSSRSDVQEFWNNQKDNGSFLGDAALNTVKNLGSAALNMTVGYLFDQITSPKEEKYEETEAIYNTHRKIAWVATANALKNNVKEMYQGGLVVIGDPSVKPYDRLIIMDNFNDMNGHVYVRDVVHSLSMQTGFSTTMNVDAISIVDDRSEFYIHSLGNTLASSSFFLAAMYMLNKFGKFYYKKANARILEEIANAKKIYDKCSFTIKSMESSVQFQNRYKYFAKQQELVELERKLASGKSFTPEELTKLDKERKELRDAIDALKKSDSIFTDRQTSSIVELQEKFDKGFSDNINSLKSLNKQESELLEKYKKAATAADKASIEAQLKTVRDSIVDTNKKLDKLEQSLKYIKKKTFLNTEEVKELLKIAKEYKLNIKVDAIDDIRTLRETIEEIRSKYKETLGDVLGVLDDNPDLARKEFFRKLDGLPDLKNKLKAFEAKTAAQNAMKAVFKSPLKTGAKMLKYGYKALFNGLALIGGGPILWAVKEFVYYMGVECMVQSLNNYLYYGIRNAQALTVFPLKKHGMAYTAGLEGSVGLVFGSPTFNNRGFTDELVNAIFPSEESGALQRTIFALVSSEDLMTEIGKIRRNNEFYSMNTNNTAGMEAKMESTVWGVAAGKTTRKFDSIVGMSSVDRTRIPDKASTVEEKEIYKKKIITIDTIDDFLSNPSATSLYNISTDPKLKKYIEIGFLKIYHVEAHKNSQTAPKNIGLERLKKDTGSGEAVDIPCIRYTEDDSVLDVPYLGYEARNTLAEIVEFAFKSLKSSNNKDIHQALQEKSGNNIIVISALRIGDKKNIESAAGISFTIVGTGILAERLSSIIEERKAESEKVHGKGNCLFEYKVLTKRGLRQNQIRVTIKPPSNIK